MRFLKVLVMLVVVTVPASSWALGRFAIGPEIGFAYQMNRDPSGAHLGGSPGFGFGLSGVYMFDRELSHVAIDYAVGMIMSSQICYRDVTIEGATGTFRENVEEFHWLVGGRYYFGRDKWRPYAGLGAGVVYMRRTDVDYRDRFNVELPSPPVSSHLNLAIVPQVGIEYRPTFRWAIGLNVRTILSIRSTGVIPGFYVPVSVHFAF